MRGHVFVGFLIYVRGQVGKSKGNVFKSHFSVYFLTLPSGKVLILKFQRGEKNKKLVHPTASLLQAQLEARVCAWNEFTFSGVTCASLLVLTALETRGCRGPRLWGSREPGLS